MILITGGLGFLGGNLLKFLINNTNYFIYIIDKNISGLNLERIKNLNSTRFKVLNHDLNHPLNNFDELININYIIHLAAESHVDNSIKNPKYCIENNILSMINVLEFARTLKSLKKIINFSTDEVYGNAINNENYTELDRYNPCNPYSASKGSCDLICNSYYHTFKLPIITINSMNIYGKMQHVEKFIPKVIYNILNNKQTIIHSYPDKKKSGSRFYIYVKDISRAILFLLNNGKNGEIYHVRGEIEKTNLELAQQISKIMNKKLNYKMVDFHSERPGHDLRYALDDTKIKKIGWKLENNFDKNIEKTINFYINNQKWLEYD